MPKFVILFHQMPVDVNRKDHWDLMLRNNDRLETWALETEPKLDELIKGHRLPDHRLHYLDYEGSVSDNRGHVSRKYHGEYEWESGPSNEGVRIARLNFPAPGPWRLTITPVNLGRESAPSELSDAQLPTFEFYFELLSLGPESDEGS